MRILVALTLLTTACGADLRRGGLGNAVDTPEHGNVEGPGVENATVSRFVGTWLIEETVPHATYFAAQYHFAAEGTLLLVENFSYDAGVAYPTISWGGGAYVVCSFGDRWSSDDDIHLEVDGACSDGVTRAMVISFDPDPSSNVVSVDPQLESVDGDTQMWHGPPWGWHFVKCEGDFSNCDPPGF